MIEVFPALKSALSAPANQPVDLYELYLDNVTLYYANQAISWGGRDYAAKVESRSAIKRFEGGEFDRVSVTFTNIDTELANLVLTHEIEGRRIIIRKIDRTVAGDSLVLFNGEMERPSRINEKTCTIDAQQLIGSVQHEVPSRLFSQYCPFPFKDYQCGYAGAGTECDKSWSQCAAYANTNRFGGFRFIPHGGTYQYTEVEKKRFLLLFSRKKKKTITATFSSVDDTPYDVPIPIIYGRVQIAGIDIQHEDAGDQTKVLSAFCVGPVESIYFIRANQAAVTDYTVHHGELGGNGDQTADPRMASGYPYNLVAYAGVTIPSDVKSVDPAPQITAIVQGRKVPVFGPGGVYENFRWTDNPVWCTRDFMTMPLEEGGMGIPTEWFDEAVNAETAAYCDELIEDHTNDQKIYNPPALPTGVAYKRFRSTAVDGGDPAVDGPYSDYEPGVDDDTSRAPVPLDVKRFTMNVAIAKQEEAVDVLFKKLLPSFRGFLTFSKDGKIQIRCERPVPNTTVTQVAMPGANQVLCGTPSAFAAGDLVLLSPMTENAETLTVSQLLADRLQFTAPLTAMHAPGDRILKIAMAFDDTNVTGGLEYPLSDRQPSTNRVTIKYADAPSGFEARELRVEDFAHQAKVHKVNNEDLDGSAIDSYFQAYRIGQWRRAKLRDLGKFCSFTADIKASLLEIGDVFALSAAEVGLQAVPFRVIELSYEENDEVSIVGQLYSIDIYDDQAPQTTVTVPTIFPAPTPPGSPETPGEVIIDEGRSYYRYSKPANTDDWKLEFVIYYAKPATAFDGVRAFAEDPDQSDGPTTHMDGSTLMDGSATMGGGWSPVPLGECPYVAGQPAIITGLPTTNYIRHVRVYLPSYTALVKPGPVRRTFDAAGNEQPGATPSIAFVVNPPGLGPEGEEYTAMALLDTSKGTSGVEIWRQSEGGIDITHIRTYFTRPDDARFSGVHVEIPYRTDDDSWTTNIAVAREAAYCENWFPTPPSQKVVVKLLSFADTGTWDPNDDAVNTYVPGKTPDIWIDIGTGAGTIDLGKTKPETIDSYDLWINELGKLATKAIDLAKVLGGSYKDAEFRVNPTTHLFEINGVPLDKAIQTTLGSALENAAGAINVKTAGIKDAMIESLAATKILAGALVSGVVYSGKINCDQLNAGTLNGIQLVLNQNGITTKIQNQYDSIYGQYVGMSITNSTNSRRTLVTNGGVAGVNDNNTVGWSIAAGACGGADVRDASGIATIQLFGQLGAVRCKQIQDTNGNQVVGTRYAVRPATLADVINVLVSHGLCV